MKGFKVLVAAAAVAMSLVSCDFGPALIYQASMPQFKPIDGKARVVLIRPEPGFFSNVIINNSTNPDNLFTSVYLDAKYTSETAVKNVVSFAVEPGEHYVFTRVIGFALARPTGKIKFNFQAGKVYYIEQTVKVAPTPVGEVQMSLLGTLAIEEATNYLGKKDLRYGEFDTTKKREDMEDKEYKSNREDYAKWAKDKPEEAKKESDYAGY